MSSFYIPLPGARSPANAMLNFDPLRRAVSDYKSAEANNAMFAYRQKQDAEAKQYRQGRDAVADQRYADERDYRRGRDELADTRYADEMSYNRGRQGAMDQRAAETHGWKSADRARETEKRLATDAAGIFQNYIDNDPDPASRAAKTRQFIGVHPKIQQGLQAQGVNLDDPAAVSQFIRAQAMEFRDATTAKAPSGYRWTANGTLEAIPGGPEDAQSGSKANLPEKISGGLNQLAGIPKEFGGGVVSSPFESAIGSIRGQEDDGGWLPTMSDVGKVWGSITNALGSRTTSEVRNRIKGDTEALAAAIKPLIRAPGEGQWSDADQERLVAVVGNLALANNEAEYKRALEQVRQRVMQNFQIELPEIQWNGQASGDVQTIKSDEDFDRLPSGALFVGPDGVQRRKP